MSKCFNFRIGFVLFQCNSIIFWNSFTCIYKKLLKYFQSILVSKNLQYRSREKIVAKEKCQIKWFVLVCESSVGIMHELIKIKRLFDVVCKKSISVLIKMIVLAVRLKPFRFFVKITFSYESLGMQLKYIRQAQRK